MGKFLGNFNSICARKLNISVEEATTHIKEENRSKLFALITEGTVLLEKKYEEATLENNYANFVVSSNNMNAVLKLNDLNCRRFVPFMCNHISKYITYGAFKRMFPDIKEPGEFWIQVRKFLVGHQDGDLRRPLLPEFYQLFQCVSTPETPSVTYFTSIKPRLNFQTLVILMRNCSNEYEFFFSFLALASCAGFHKRHVSDTREDENDIAVVKNVYWPGLSNPVFPVLTLAAIQNVSKKDPEVYKCVPPTNWLLSINNSYNMALDANPNTNVFKKKGTSDYRMDILRSLVDNGILSPEDADFDALTFSHFPTRLTLARHLLRIQPNFASLYDSDNHEFEPVSVCPDVLDLNSPAFKVFSMPAQDENILVSPPPKRIVVSEDQNRPVPIPIVNEEQSEELLDHTFHSTDDEAEDVFPEFIRHEFQESQGI